MTLTEVRDKLFELGCVSAIILDGGGSSQVDTDGTSEDVYSSRIVSGFVCVWAKKATNTITPKEDVKMKVCLDPGHGNKELNQSPDGSYLEHEFALDMAKRIRVHLERCGVDVKLTREDSSTPSLTERAMFANKYGANLYVALHTNAVPDKDPTDENTPQDGWDDSVHGLTVWTYAVGGERDKAANALLAQMASLGVETFGSKLYHSKFTVLAKTNMPAYLIEYAFHTCHNDVALLKSDSHRAKLALATAKAICTYGGVKWVDEPVKQTITYKIQIDLTDETEAENLTVELTAKGYKPYITTEVKA